MNKTISNQNKSRFTVLVMLILSVLCLGFLLMAGFPTVSAEIRAATHTELPPTVTNTPNPTRTSVPSHTPSHTRTPSPMPTNTYTPTPVMVVACVQGVNLRVRSGPGTHYETTAGLANGECVQLEGRNEAGDWLEYSHGWISAEFLSYEGQLDHLPVATTTASP
jgi:hypothetical protein